MSGFRRYAARVWCLLRGGHRAVAPLPTAKPFVTIQFGYGDKFTAAPCWFHYEPCVRCGALFLYDWGNGALPCGEKR